MLTDREKEVLDIIKKNPMISQNEIAEKLGITRSTASVFVANLISKGVIAGKGYVISEDYVVCIGTCVADIAASMAPNMQAGDKNPGGKVRLASGGAGRNMGENLARLGAGVKLLSTIGDDIFGKKMMDDCTAAGMDVSGVKVVQGENSSVYVLFLDGDGDLVTGVTDLDIIKHISVDYYKASHHILQNARAILFSAEATPQVFRYLHTTYPDIPLIVDATTLAHSYNVKECIDCFHTIKANNLEAAILSDIEIKTEEDIEAAADVILSKGATEIIISMGGDGIFYKHSDGTKRRKRTKKIEKMANATGAGDALSAGYVFGMLNGYDKDYQLDFAMAAAVVALSSDYTINPEICEPLVIETMNKIKL